MLTATPRPAQSFRCFFHSRGLLASLAQEREVGGWHKLARFSPRVSWTAWALFALVSWNTVFVNFTWLSFFDVQGWFHDNDASEPADILVSVLEALARQVVNLLLVCVFVVFGVMWKLMMLGLTRVCDRIRHGGGGIVWSSLTHITSTCIPGLSACGGLGVMAPSLPVALASLHTTRSDLFGTICLLMSRGQRSARCCKRCERPNCKAARADRAAFVERR